MIELEIEGDGADQQVRSVGGAVFPVIVELRDRDLGCCSDEIDATALRGTAVESE